MATWLLDSAVELLPAKPSGMLPMSACLLESSVKLLIAEAPELLRTAAWLSANDVLQDTADEMSDIVEEPLSSKDDLPDAEVSCLAVPDV